jgi:excisionase family DNA binding protein
MDNQFPEVMDVRTCCEFLQITQATLNKLIKNKEIPSAKIGGQWRFSKRQMLEFLEDQAELEMSRSGVKNFEEVDDDQEDSKCEEGGFCDWRPLDRRRKQERKASEKGYSEICTKCQIVKEGE